MKEITMYFNDANCRTKRRKLPPFAKTHRMVRQTRESNGQLHTWYETSRPIPQKLTRKLRRHLAKVERGNLAEADRQRGMIGRPL